MADQNLLVPFFIENLHDPFFLEAEFCWMIIKPQCLTPVLDQGPTAICYAFGAVTTMHADMYLRRKPMHCLGSVQEIMNELHTHNEYLPLGPVGQLEEVPLPHEVPVYGYANRVGCVFDYARRFGMFPWSNYPFVGFYQLPGTYHVETDYKLYTYGFEDCLDISNRDGILEKLKTQPLVGAMDVYPSFRILREPDRIYYGICDPDTKIGTHFVTLIGFGGRRGIDDYFIIQNSWGENWGHRGYAKVRQHLVTAISCPVGTEIRPVVND